MEHLMGRYRNVSILAAAIFLQIVGLAVQVKRRSENHSTRLIRVWTVAVVTPLEKAINQIQNGTSDVWHNYVYLRGVRQQNRALQDQIQQLQLEQVRLRQDAEQARRLQALLGFKEQYVDKTVAAQVIGASGSEQSRLVYLDKGTADGLATDMAVISEQGAVGKVVQVFRHTSQVLLINDQNSGVGTILERSRLQGVLKGRASGELVLDKIMAEEDIQPGDRVLTSGGDQIFPKGLPVGTVARVTRGKEFLEVAVRPAASLNHLEEVLVITRKQEREPSAVASSEQMRAADILAERLPSVPDKPAPGTTATIPTLAGGTPKTLVKPAVPAVAPQSGAAQLPGANPQSQSKIQGTPAAPRTQAVDFVRPNAASSSNGGTPKPAAPKASSANSQAENGVVDQNKAQPALATTAGKTSNPVSSPERNPNGVSSAKTPTGTSAKPAIGTTGLKSASAAKSTPVGTQTGTIKTAAPANSKPATSEGALKPVVPANSKPAVSTPQPSPQSESGDAPQ